MNDIVASVRKLNPSFRHNWDALACAAHCVLLNFGFVVVDGQGHILEHSLPIDWNFAESYNFQYCNDRSTMKFFVKMIPFCSKMVILAFSDGERDTIHQLILEASDFIYDGEFADLQQYYKNIDNLKLKVHKEIVEKLVPTFSLEQPATKRLNAYPLADPLRIPNTSSNPWRNSSSSSSSSIFDVGREDLRPPGFAGPNAGGFGGMLIGPNHPGFASAFGHGNSGNRMHPDSDLFDPDGLRPRFPGVRYDPIGPGGSDPDWDGVPPPGTHMMFM